MQTALTSRINTLRVGRFAAAPKAARRNVLAVKADATTTTTEGKTWMLNAPGISAPTGEPGKSFFDPLGFTDQATFSIVEAKRFREAELTHGRVAMLAALGWFVQEEFPVLFNGQIRGPAFVHFQQVEQIWPQFWEVILLAIAIAEGYRISTGWNEPTLARQPGQQLRSDYTPGDLGFDPLGLYPSDADAQYDLKTKELNNGRLAMIAIAGFAAQEEVNHVTIWKNLIQENVIPAAEQNILPIN